MPRTKVDQEKVRQAVADLIRAAGCSCCRDDEGWKNARKTLATLLAVPAHKEDLDYFDFTPFQTDQKP